MSERCYQCNSSDLVCADCSVYPLVDAAEAVLVGLRPIKSNGKYVNRFYGPEIERLDALVREWGPLKSDDTMGGDRS